MVDNEVLAWILTNRILPWMKNGNGIFTEALFKQPDTFANWVRTMLVTWLKDAEREMKIEIGSVHHGLTANQVMKALCEMLSPKAPQT